MNVRELVAALSRFDPETPVIVDNPNSEMGPSYGEVLTVGTDNLLPDPDDWSRDTYSVWQDPGWLNTPSCPDCLAGRPGSYTNHSTHSWKPPPRPTGQPVVILGQERPHRPVIDGELGLPELT